MSHIDICTYFKSKKSRSKFKELNCFIRFVIKKNPHKMPYSILLSPTDYFGIYLHISKSYTYIVIFKMKFIEVTMVSKMT